MFCLLTRALIVVVDMLVQFRAKRTKQMNCPMNRKILMHVDQIFNCVNSSFFNSPRATRQGQVWHRYGIVVAILGEEVQIAIPLIPRPYSYGTSWSFYGLKQN